MSGPPSRCKRLLQSCRWLDVHMSQIAALLMGSKGMSPVIVSFLLFLKGCFVDESLPHVAPVLYHMLLYDWNISSNASSHQQLCRGFMAPWEWSGSVCHQCHVRIFRLLYQSFHCFNHPFNQPITLWVLRTACGMFEVVWLGKVIKGLCIKLWTIVTHYYLRDSKSWFEYCDDSRTGSCWELLASSICQNPLLASSLLKSLAPESCASISSTFGRGWISRSADSFSGFRSTQILIFPSRLGTTTIPAHQGVRLLLFSAIVSDLAESKTR